MSALETKLSESFDALVKRERGPGWLNNIRRAGMEEFRLTGFPTVKNEDWKYTSVTPLTQLSFESSNDKVPHLELDQVPLFSQPSACPRLVFVNGKFVERLSCTGPFQSSVVVQSLKSALSQQGQSLEFRLARFASTKDNPFVALNTALIDDGASIHVAEGQTVDRPIEIFYLSSSEHPIASHPRNLILLDPGAHASLVEVFIGRSQVYWTNAVTEVVLAKNAHLEHYKLQEEALGAYHVASTFVRQERDSSYSSYLLSSGAALARNEIRTVFTGENASCNLTGLYMGTGRQHLDNRTLIDHATPHCSSRELYKGILDEHSRGVFNGRVIVREGAMKTDAGQINKNLLLSEDAWVDTKPQLEIFADDVKCSHGATVGQLDEESVFYLRTRGISESKARGLLTHAFASDTLQAIKPLAVRERVEEVISSRLLMSERRKGMS